MPTYIEKAAYLLIYSDTNIQKHFYKSNRKKLSKHKDLENRNWEDVGNKNKDNTSSDWSSRNNKKKESKND